MADVFEHIKFTANMSLAAAQIIPVLGLAFIVEMRLLATDAKKGWQESRQMLRFTCGVIAVSVVIMLAGGTSDASGVAAISRWITAVGGIGYLCLVLALSIGASLSVAEKQHEETAARTSAAPRKQGWLRKRVPSA